MVLPVKTTGITSVFEERLRSMKEKDPDNSMSLFTKKRRRIQTGEENMAKAVFFKNEYN